MIKTKPHCMRMNKKKKTEESTVDVETVLNK